MTVAGYLETTRLDIYFVLTPQFAAINKKQLGEVIDNCKAFRYEIVSSIDFLITGF